MNQPERRPLSQADRLDEVRALSERLVAVADEGEAEGGPHAGLVVFGVVRDCVWKIRAALSAFADGPHPGDQAARPGGVERSAT